MKTVVLKKVSSGLLILAVMLYLPLTAQAREVEYQGSEETVTVTPGEPTQVRFPGLIQGGFKKNLSALHLDRKDSDLIVFGGEGLPAEGEAIIVRLKDGRSYSLRIVPSSEDRPRDATVKIIDRSVGYSEQEEDPAYKEQVSGYAPASSVSGLMREMVLFAEFGKKSISGYKVSDRYRGETVLSDGAMHAAIDLIFMGPTLWGYVLDAKNNLDQTMKLNPATFRLDGTRAISAKNWELAPRPLNAEQQVAGKDSTKVYVITRPKRFE